jgi:tetratricopeptide (TPR) repeat protein
VGERPREPPRPTLIKTLPKSSALAEIHQHPPRRPNLWLDFVSQSLHLSRPMNSMSVHQEETLSAARHLCEGWAQVLDLARAWQKESPDDPRAFYYLALGHSGLGQFVQAETAYRRALELDPSDINLWHKLGRLLYEHRNRPLDGIRCVEQALKLDPAQKVAWSNLAEMVGRLGHHVHAMMFADRALELDSQFVEAYLHKGAAARALGKKEILRDVCSALGAIPPEKFCRTM